MLGFSGIFKFAAWGSVCVGFAMIGVCFLTISFIFFRSIVVYLKLRISIDICIDISIDILTDKEEGGGGKEWTSSQILTTPHRRVGKNSNNLKKQQKL